MTEPVVPQTEKAYQNTDRELWRERPDDYYADSIFVTGGGGIGMNVGGFVVVMPIREWHKLARPALPAPEPPDADTLAMAKFIYGWWPGLEDDIDWSDSDAHPAYQAAKRIMERGTAAPAPPDPKEPQ